MYLGPENPRCSAQHACTTCLYETHAVFAVALCAELTLQRAGLDGMRIPHVISTVHTVLGNVDLLDELEVCRMPDFEHRSWFSLVHTSQPLVGGLWVGGLVHECGQKKKRSQITPTPKGTGYDFTANFVRIMRA